ncbi:MAG: ATP-binding protein [Desulfarculaceae bacterium]
MTKQDRPREDQELLRLKEIIQHSRNKLQAVFDTIADPIFSLTPQGNIESLNMSAARLGDRHPRELVGLSTEEFLEAVNFSPPLREAFTDAFAKALTQAKWQWRLVEVPKPEGVLFFEITVTPCLNDKKQVTLGIAQLKDVTTFKRMEQAIRDYSQSLEEKVHERTSELMAAQKALLEKQEHLVQTNQELRRLDKLRSDLTNMVVHDLKGPLSEVMGNLDLLSYGKLDETQQEARDLALLGAEDLYRMIMNLLDIDRIEESRLQIKPEPIELKDLAETVVSRFKTLVRLKGLQVEIKDDCAQSFPADPNLLSRVLQNLFTNALTYTAEGGNISIAGKESDDGGVIIKVKDTGVGIPQRHQKLIFQKFTQAGTHSGPRTSTGLGLTFCKLAVEAHGGRIWVQSTEGEGSTFFVWLPRP